MKKLLLILISIFYISLIKAQSFDWKNHEIKNDTDLIKTATWLYASPSNSILGTGYFFYSKKKKELYLITNRHLIENNINLVFGYHQQVREDSSFRIDSLQYRVKFFKRKDLDLAAIRIDNIPYLDLNQFNYFKVFTEDNMLSKEDSSAIDIFDNKIIALSFPGKTTIPFPFQPYIIHCNLSVPFEFKFQYQNDLVIEGNLTKGCSGSPIIFIYNKADKKRYCLLGTYYFSFARYQAIDSVTNDTIKDYAFDPIMDKQYINNGENKTMSGYKINQLLNIGLAVKSNYLLELINNY